MEFKVTDTDRYAFTGAVKFNISEIADYISSGYKVKSAVLRTTTMKRNTGSELSAVPFMTDFGEDYDKNDILGDEFTDTIEYVMNNYDSYTIGGVSCARSGRRLNEYAAEAGADPDITRWYNNTDITSYLAGAAVAGSDELPLLIYTQSETDKTGNQLCTKDVETDNNWDIISGFYTPVSYTHLDVYKRQPHTAADSPILRTVRTVHT